MFSTVPLLNAALIAGVQLAGVPAVERAQVLTAATVATSLALLLAGHSERPAALRPCPVERASVRSSRLDDAELRDLLAAW